MYEYSLTLLSVRLIESNVDNKGAGLQSAVRTIKSRRDAGFEEPVRDQGCDAGLSLAEEQ